MSVEVGKTYYFWCHAYLRLVGRVVAIHGSRRVNLEDVSKVMSDGDGDESFFAKGVTNQKVAYLGDVPDAAYIMAVEFNHPLPKRKVK